MAYFFKLTLFQWQYFVKKIVTMDNKNAYSL